MGSILISNTSNTIVPKVVESWDDLVEFVYSMTGFPVYSRLDEDSSLSLDVALAEIDPSRSQQERLDFALDSGLLDLSEVNATSNAILR